MSSHAENAVSTKRTSDEFWLKVSKFLTHPATASIGSAINGLKLYSSLKGHGSKGELDVALMGAEASVGWMAISTYETVQGIKERRRQRANDLPHSKQENFTEYAHFDEEGAYQSPFLVAVVGIRKELLGLGKVIGGLREGTDPDFTMPVIAIPDHRAPGGVVELLGDECYWVPADEGIVDVTVPLMVDGMTVPAFDYQRALELDLPDPY